MITILMISFAYRTNFLLTEPVHRIYLRHKNQFLCHRTCFICYCVVASSQNQFMLAKHVSYSKKEFYIHKFCASRTNFMFTRLVLCSHNQFQGRRNNFMALRTSSGLAEPDLVPKTSFRLTDTVLDSQNQCQTHGTNIMLLNQFYFKASLIFQKLYYVQYYALKTNFIFIKAVLVLLTKAMYVRRIIIMLTVLGSEKQFQTLRTRLVESVVGLKQFYCHRSIFMLAELVL